MPPGRGKGRKVAVLQAENAELKRSLERFERWFHLSMDLMGRMDFAGNILELSSATQDIFGHPPEEVYKHNFLEYVHPDDLEATLREFEHLQQGQKIRSFTHRIEHADHSYRWIWWWASPAVDEGCIYAMGRDVTEERQREEHVLQVQKLEALGRLTGGIAHDFNNYLQGVITNLGLARRRLAHHEEGVERFLIGAESGTQRAAALARQLLVFARHESLKAVVTDVAGIVRRLRPLLRQTAGERIALELHIPDEAWWALCDPVQLETAVLNMLLNARDAMPSGGKVGVHLENAHFSTPTGCPDEGILLGDYVMLSVQDNGEGMSEETAARAFEPFFTTKTAAKGTGLGLSQVYGFAKKAGGKTTISSQLGQGTTITVYLRRHRGKMEISHPPLQAEVEPKGSGRLLLVEDEELVRTALSSALEEMDYKVVAATNAAEALDSLALDEPFDLLLTDVGLPDMNGAALAETALKQWPGLKALCMTGHLDQAQTFPQGLDVLRKPFSMEDLNRKIEHLLHG